MWGDIAIAFVLAAITAFVSTPYTIKLAKKLGAIDVPNDRRINKKPIPRLGGIAIILGFLVSMLYLTLITFIEKGINNYISEYRIQLIGFFLGGSLIAIMCFIDDVKNVPAYIKLIVQIISAIIAISFGIRIEEIAQISMPTIVSILLTLGWIVGITNAINLIDGLDGLSTGISIISSVSLIIIFSLNDSPMIAILLITALAGSLTGFLPFNFNPAKTFMGDAGSNFLGYSIAIISIFGIAKTYTLVVIAAPLIVLGLPVFDTIFAIIRRLITGKNIKAIVKPDNKHLHHRIMNLGLSQRKAVIILYVMSATCGMFAIILLESGIWKALSFALIVFAFGIIGMKDILTKKEEGK